MPLHICGGRPAGPSWKRLSRSTSSGFWEGLFPGMFCSGASLVWQLLPPRRAGELLPIQCPTQLSSWEQLRNPMRPLEYGGAAGGGQTPRRQRAAPHSKGSSSSFVAPGSLPGKRCSHPEDTPLGPLPDCLGPRLLPPEHPGALIQMLAVWTWPSEGAGDIKPWPCGWFLVPARVEAGQRLFCQEAPGTEEREASGAGWTLLRHSSWGRGQGWAKGAFHVEEGLA